MQHLDEGTIHAWLDGQLSRDEAQAIDEHVAECRQCADAVAEARGLIAASSRILMALDGVPREVVPLPAVPRVEAGAVTGAPSSPTASAPSRAERRTQRRWFSGPSLAAAAAVVVAVGTFALARSSKRAQLGDAAMAPIASTVSGPIADSVAASPAVVPASPVPDTRSAEALGRSSPAPSPAKDAPVPNEPKPFSDAGGRQVAQNAVRAQPDAAKEEQRDMAPARQAFSSAKAKATTGAANETTVDRLEARRQLAASPPSLAADERKKTMSEQAPPVLKPSRDSAALVVLRGSSSVVGRLDSGVARADAANLQTAATGVVRGRVTDANNTGLAGAMVNVAGSTTGVATNSAGEFTLGGLSVGQHRLTVRRIGYAEVNRDVAIVAGQTVTADVTLSPSVLALEKVVTTGAPSAAPAPSPAQSAARARAAAPLETAPGAPITATQSNAVGCYELGITPSAGQVRTGFRQVPRRIALDSEIVPANAEGVWYRARDLSRVGAAPNGLWRPAGPDAIELEWTYGTRTGHVRLTGPAGSMMRGSIEEIDRATATGEAGSVVAVRRPCDG